MFERFTDRARRVVVLAQEEARMLNHDYIGTEHILLGLVSDSESVAAQALESLDVSLVKVRDRVREMVGVGEKPPGGHIPFTGRAKKVMELSLREALELHDYAIGTNHLLLGLIREGDGAGAVVLRDLRVNYADARSAVQSVIADKDLEVAESEASRTRAFRFERGETRRWELSMGPVCPGCGSLLAQSAIAQEMDVPIDSGEGSRPITFVFCSECGATVGTLLGDT